MRFDFRNDAVRDAEEKLITLFSAVWCIAAVAGAIAGFIWLASRIGLWILLFV